MRCEISDVCIHKLIVNIHAKVQTCTFTYKIQDTIGKTEWDIGQFHITALVDAWVSISMLLIVV